MRNRVVGCVYTEHACKENRYEGRENREETGEPAHPPTPRPHRRMSTEIDIRAGLMLIAPKDCPRPPSVFILASGAILWYIKTC